MKAVLHTSLLTLFFTSLALADAPLVSCDGNLCGGGGPTNYAYEVDAASYPMLEFSVGTEDLDPANYTNVLTPLGWNFAVEPTGLPYACGLFTPHGGISTGCWGLTRGRAHWWTDDDINAVEQFTFGFDHPWLPEDVGWELVTHQAQQVYTFIELWDAPVGTGAGPLHGPRDLPAIINLGPEEQIGTTTGGLIDVTGYSVPSFVPWNGDELDDLLVGEGGSGVPGKVRVYLNLGTWYRPEFDGYSYAQTYLGDLEVPSEGCLGIFPRVVYWDGDARKDLLVGRADGRVMIFLNVNTDEDPIFDTGTFLVVGEMIPAEIDVGARACSTAVDWNSDGRKDLVVGALDGYLHIFINEGTDTAPVFWTQTLALMDDGSTLYVPTGRASPATRDLDGDGMKDLLSGNTEGQVLFYPNTGSDEDPSFTYYAPVCSLGVPINLAGTPRSRQALCSWTQDGYPDLLVGAADGLVRLYQGLHRVGDLNCDGDVNTFDIDPFVLALTATPPEYPEYYAAYPNCDHTLADCNNDGMVNTFDIDAFVDLLTGG